MTNATVEAMERIRKMTRSRALAYSDGSIRQDNRRWEYVIQQEDDGLFLGKNEIDFRKTYTRRYTTPVPSNWAILHSG